jgi:hypothetical protein
LSRGIGATPVFSLATDVLQSAKIGDEIAVVGNRQGAGVATQVSGQLDGIGPNRIEVDAQFEAGDSGSPIFDVTTQQVIGVATYRQTMAVRCFRQSNRGYRPGRSRNQAGEPMVRLPARLKPGVDEPWSHGVFFGAP